MKTNKYIAVIILLALIMSTPINSKLAQPDFILYGTATWFGEPLANGSEITIFLENQLLTVAKYSMGTDTNLTGLYALRVPMDDIDPRQHGKSRPGDPATVYINGNLVAELVIGDYGTTARLDLDPLNLSGTNPIITVLPAQIVEGNSGSSMLNIDFSLSTAADDVVTVNWTTLDGTAIGQEACAFDVDYVNANGIATMAAQATSTTIQVEICGDTIIEDSETFTIVLSQANNAVIQFNSATATILDDDGTPELRGFDIMVFEPATGSLVENFQLNLSRAYEQDVSFDFTTVANSATAGTDYITTAGNITITAGDTQVLIPVEFLADTTTESIEVLQLQISNVINAQLVTANLTAFIMDANREQQTNHNNDINNNDVADLISPSSVIFSHDNQHVYVASISGDGSILHFSFNTGSLNHIATIKNTTTGFETATLKLIRQIVLAPNGDYLYAAASGDNAISAFTVNTTTGELGFIGNIVETFAGEFGINGIFGLVVSQDGKHLYAAGSDSDSIAAFNIEQATGVISHIESEIMGVDDPNDSGPAVTFMDKPINLTLSPDGEYIYVAAEFSSAVVVFARDNSDGKLNYMQSLKSGINGVQELAGSSGVVVSNDGNHLYAIARTDNAIVTFYRAADGTISFSNALSRATPDFIGMQAPNAIITNATDDNLHILGFDDSSMVTFNRDNLATSLDYGGLEFADIEQDGLNNVTKMNGPTALDISSNGRWIIVAAGIDNALTVFSTPLSEVIFSNSFE